MASSGTSQRHMRAIEKALADGEDAIRAHPPETFRIYEMALQAYEGGLAQAPEPEGLELLGLTWDESKTISRYLFCMAFISAWYHVHGDREHRDKTARSVAAMMALTPRSAESSFKELLEYERLHRENFTRLGIGRRSIGCTGLVFVALAVAASYAIIMWRRQGRPRSTSVLGCLPPRCRCSVEPWLS